MSAVHSIADVIAAVLADDDIEFTRAADDLFVFQLRGERKQTIPVTLVARERTLVVESFFMRAPIEGHEELYRFLLHRNATARRVHFALGDRGDVYIVGQVALEGLDGDSIDELLGEILMLADGTFDRAIALGFATYLRNDLAWRRGATPPPAG